MKLISIVVFMLFSFNVSAQSFDSPDRVKSRHELLEKKKEAMLKYCENLEDNEFTDELIRGWKPSDHKIVMWRQMWPQRHSLKVRGNCDDVGFKP